MSKNDNKTNFEIIKEELEKLVDLIYISNKK